MRVIAVFEQNAVPVRLDKNDKKSAECSLVQTFQKTWSAELARNKVQQNDSTVQ